MLKMTTVAVSLLAGSYAFAAASARADESLATSAFAGATNLQTWIAQDKGFFAREGLNVTLEVTQGSLQETRDLLSGKFQIISSAFDNTVADMEGQGEAQIPGASDLVVFMAVNAGFNSLVSRPEDKTFDSLRGKVAAVDAKRSGYALVMYDLLAKRGLQLDKDYTTLPVGGTPNRMKALASGEAAFAMTSAPEDTAAQAKGYNILADSRELGPFQGSVFVTKRSWANAHRELMGRYIRAIVAATDVIFADKATAIAVLRSHQPNLSAEAAEALHATLISFKGFNPQAKINMKGVETVLRVREAYGEPKRKLDPPSAYIDESYYEEAVAQKK